MGGSHIRVSVLTRFFAEGAAEEIHCLLENHANISKDEMYTHPLVGAWGCMCRDVAGGISFALGDKASGDDHNACQQRSAWTCAHVYARGHVHAYMRVPTDVLRPRKARVCPLHVRLGVGASRRSLMNEEIRSCSASRGRVWRKACS